MQADPSIIVGAAAGLVGAMLYAVSVVIYRSQSENIHPIAVGSIKMWVSALFMTFIVLLPIGASPLMIPFEAAVILAGSIVLGAVIGDTLYLVSQERIGISYAFPIAMTFPVLTFVFAIVFLNEPVVVGRLVGAVIAVAGTIIISLEQASTEENGEPKTRDLLGFASAVVTTILYAIGAILIQVGLRDYNVDAISGNFVRMIAGGFAFIPIFALAKHRGMKIPSRRVAKTIAITGFFGMAIGALLYVYAIEQAGAAITSVVASTAPLFAVPLSIYYLNERPTKRTILGIVATVLGVILVVFGV